MKNILIGFLVGYGVSYQLDPQIYLEYNYSPLLDRIISKCPSLSSGFHPTPWLFGGFLQGLYGMGPGSSANKEGNTDYSKYEREFFRLSDSGIVSIDWKLPRLSSSKILLIVPGLSGNGNSEYVRTAVSAAHKFGYEVGVIHGRGIANNPLMTLNVHNLCSEEDVGKIIKKVRKKNPHKKIMALGTSMGAGLLLKYAKSSGRKCVLDGIAVVAAPFDYIECRARLNNFFPYFGIADRFIVDSLLTQFESIKVHLSALSEELEEKKINLEDVRNIKTSKEFDEEFTIKLVGYQNTEDYYKDASIGYDLNDIKVPTLSLNSLDDPVVPFNLKRAKNITKNPLVLLAYTKVGGHVGFYTGLAPKRWYALPCLEFFEGILNS